MDRKQARRNMRFGISLFILVLSLVGATFVWASVYLQVIK
jgi:hypothetical protein